MTRKETIAQLQKGSKVIGACDICDAQNVPIMKGRTFGCEIASCYPCQGESVPKDEAREAYLIEVQSLNKQALDHPPYDNPRDPFASRDRLPPDFTTRPWGMPSSDWRMNVFYALCLVVSAFVICDLWSQP